MNSEDMAERQVKSALTDSFLDLMNIQMTSWYLYHSDVIVVSLRMTYGIGSSTVYSVIYPLGILFYNRNKSEFIFPHIHSGKDVCGMG